MDITNQQKENIQLVVDALKANKKKAIRMMRDKDGGRCCLCVIQDTLKEKYPKAYRGMKDLANNHIPYGTPFFNLLGFKSVQPFTIGGETDVLSCHNDGTASIHHKDIKEKTHVQIAEALEQRFLK